MDVLPGALRLGWSPRRFGAFAFLITVIMRLLIRQLFFHVSIMS